jgi:hypothetical protein
MDEHLIDICERLLKYVTFTNRVDVNGKPYAEVSIQIGNKVTIDRIVEGKESERHTFPVTLAELDHYLHRSEAIKKSRLPSIGKR